MLHIDKFVRGVAQERSVALTVDQDASTELARLDGCYALRTDLSKAAIERDRARPLQRPEVEWAFRDSKSVHLEMRPVYLRAGSRTSGHAVVVIICWPI